MEDGIVSKLDFKEQIEFQMTEIRDTVFWGVSEKDRRVPDMPRAF